MNLFVFRKSFIRLLVGGLTVSSLLSLMSSSASAQNTPNPIINSHPQYIAMRKAQTASHAQTCCVMDGGHPDQITKEGFLEIINAVGTRGTEDRKLAVLVFFDTLNASIENQKKSLQNLVALSKDPEIRLPIIINFDTFGWWDSRPDLWNWFDPSLPGYNPANINNVEWDGPSPSNATKIAWRNWGSQMRVRPHPNIASTGYRQANKAVLDVLFPIVQNFYQSLKPEEKYLYGGIVWGGEWSMGVNYYYYPNGNQYYDRCKAYTDECQTRAGDPKTGLDFTKNDAGGLRQLGFAAANKMGIQNFGNQATLKSDIKNILRNYMEYLNSIAANYQLPTAKYSSHGGGTFNGGHNPDTVDIAKVSNQAPGWSLYGVEADNPEIFLQRFMQNEKNSTLPWSAPEWLSFRGNDKKAWNEALENTLNYKNNKLLSVSNWESVHPDRNANWQNNGQLAAIRQVLEQPRAGSCTISPTLLLGASPSGSSTTTLTFSGNKPNTATYLLVSNSKALDGYGLLQNPNILNKNITGMQNVAAPIPATTFVQLVTDGCNGKRIYSEVFQVTNGTYSSGSCKRNAGDANCDTIINLLDFVVIKSEFSKINTNLQSDFNRDNKVDIADFNIFRLSYVS